MHISSLHIYPVKSARAINLEQSPVGLLGLEGDRRWMIVDSQGKMVSQRELRALTQLHVSLTPRGLALNVGQDSVEVLTPPKDTRLAVDIWGSDVDAAFAGKPAQEFLTHHFDRPLTLVFHDTQAKRLIAPEWNDGETEVAFADGFPLLIATEDSLDALNAALVGKGEQSVPMTRFRPNIVLSGAPAWADDGWQTVRIGKIEFELVKPCSRCIMTTNNPETGERANNEPMTTLATLRRSGDKRVRGVLFGWNAIARSSGIINVGDSVEITATKPAPWPII